MPGWRCSDYPFEHSAEIILAFHSVAAAIQLVAERRLKKAASTLVSLTHGSLPAGTIAGVIDPRISRLGIWRDSAQPPWVEVISLDQNAPQLCCWARGRQHADPVSLTVPPTYHDQAAGARLMQRIRCAAAQGTSNDLHVLQHISEKQRSKHCWANNDLSRDQHDGGMKVPRHSRTTVMTFTPGIDLGRGCAAGDLSSRRAIRRSMGIHRVRGSACHVG